MNQRLRPAITFSAITLGVTSMVSQVAILRELFVVFYGNELSIGLALACWLLCVAVGSWVIGRYAEDAAKKPQAMMLIQVSVALMIPLLMFISRCIRNIFPLSPGEIMGIGPMLLSSTAVLAPLCLLLGFTFALLCVSTPKGPTGTTRIGSVYVLEALGSTGGGILFSLLLVKFLTPTHIAFLLGGANLAAGLFTVRSARFRVIPVSLLLAYIIAFSSGATGKLENAAVVSRWRGFKLEYNANSIYGNITVVSLGREHAFYQNGFLSFSTGDVRFAEETAHIPLLSHPSPKNILLIGGGMSGVLHEILKHPVESATCVELDPLVIDAAKVVRPEETHRLLEDTRLNIVFDDGRRFVKTTEARFDVVILNLPDPLNALVNRFYSLEFFEEIKRVLAPRGIVSLGLTLAENYLNPEQQRLLACIHATASSSFSEVILIPGAYTYILASHDRSLANISAGLLLDRSAKLAISTDFITPGYLPFRMDPERTAFFMSSVHQTKGSSVNSDLAPEAYVDATVAWLIRLGSRCAHFLERASDISHFWYFLPFAVLFGGLIYPTLRHSDSRAPIATAIFTTGYAEMVFQVVVIYSFQVFFGYLYYRLGFILTSFMLGLALGGYVMTARAGSVRAPRILFIKIQLGMCAYPILLALFLVWISKLAGTTPLPFPAQTAFAFLPAVAGFLGGIQFPLAAQIYLEDGESSGRTAGYLYGIDLAGSCSGAILASSLLIPVIGVTGTCLVAFVGNTAALFLMFISLARRRLWR